MKKTFALALVLGVVLAGCAATAPAPQSLPTQPQADTAQLAHSGLQLLNHAVDGGFYVSYEDATFPLLEYINYADHTVQSICKKENCPHSNETCNAYLHATYYYADSDYLFYYSTDANGSIDAIVRMNTDGDNRQIVFEKPASDMLFMTGDCLARDGDTLYFTMQEFHYTQGTYTTALHQVSIRTGESSVLYATQDIRLAVSGLYQGKLLLHRTTNQSDEGFEIFEALDTQTGEAQELLRIPSADLQHDDYSFSAPYYKDDFLYYFVVIQNSPDLLAGFNVSNHEKHLSWEGLNLSPQAPSEIPYYVPNIECVLGRSLVYWLHLYNVSTYETSLYRYVLDLDTGLITEIPFSALHPVDGAAPDAYEASPITILHATEDFLLVIPEYRHQITASSSHQSSSTVVSSPVYSLIPTKDFLNGVENFTPIIPVD